MKDWADDHVFLTCTLIGIAIVLVCVGIVYGDRIISNAAFQGNKQVVDTKVRFTWAIIEVGNGELIEAPVKAWNDYNESDMLQVILEDDTVILTHSSKILLCSECP